MTVTDDEQGNLVAETKITVDGTKADEIVFKNTYVKPEPGISIEKLQAVNDGQRTKDTLVVEANDEVTYYLVIKNPGTATAEGVVVKDLCNANETQTFVEKDVDIVALSVDSPVVQEDGSTVRFMYYDSTSVPTEACVAGSFNGWKIGATPMEKDDNDIWSIDIKDFAPADN